MTNVNVLISIHLIRHEVLYGQGCQTCTQNKNSGNHTEATIRKF